MKKKFNPTPVFRWMGENRKNISDLARLAGIGRVTLHNVLNGNHKPTFDTFLAIHIATNIPPSDLISDEAA